MSRYNYFTQVSIEKSTLKTIIDNLKIDLDTDMLVTIEDYLNRVKQNSTETKEYLEITILENSEALSLFYGEGDENNPSGVYLQMYTDNMSEDEIDAFDECDLRSCFDEEDCVCLHHDAELICRVIQYLSMNIFGALSNQITLKISHIKDISSTNNPTKAYILGVIILLVAATIFLFWAWIEFEDNEYIITAIVAAASGIWCVRKLLSESHN